MPASPCLNLSSAEREQEDILMSTGFHYDRDQLRKVLAVEAAA